MPTATPQRRQLRFTTLGDILADAERCVAANAPTTGQWSLGQDIEHLARVMEKSMDGFHFTTPWFVRLIAPLIKGPMLRKPMKAGFQLPPAAAAELVPGPTDANDALEHLRRTIARLENEPRRVKSPVFGTLTNEEWDQLFLRHAELHLSFARPINENS